MRSRRRGSAAAAQKATPQSAAGSDPLAQAIVQTEEALLRLRPLLTASGVPIRRLAAAAAGAAKATAFLSTIAAARAGRGPGST